MSEVQAGRGPIEVAVIDASNAEVGKVALPQAFARRVNDWLLFDEVLAQRATSRRGTAATKTRGKIRGGGKKPWKQKGTGRARASSIRSPIWRGGGTTFGPQPRSYAYRLPRKSRRVALTSALAQKARDQQVRVLSALKLEQPKTKPLRTMLETLGVAHSVLIVVGGRDRNLELSARNLPGVLVLPVAGLNVYDILRHEYLLVVQEALPAIEERMAQ